MKKFIVILLSNFIFTISFAQTDAAYRIFGEIMTVENKVYKGFITWNGNKNYWIDFFEASKIENPYRSYFKRSDGLVFRANDREFITPPTHNFCCRFGNIKSIRPTDVNEIVLQLKNGDRLTLVKGYSSDINTHIRITTPTETTSIKWDHISEIHFMGADKEAIAPETNQVAGTVKSTQGIYKGIIYWNSQQRQSQEKMNQINIFLNKIKKLYAFKGKNGNHTFGLIPLVSPNDDPADAQINALYPVENITINMPNIGSVCVSRAQFEELTIIPISELNLLSYDDFPSPQAIKGEVVTRSPVTWLTIWTRAMNLKCSTVKTIRSATVSRFVTSAPSHQKITNIPLSRYGITVSSAWEKLVMSIRITMELLFSGTVKIQYTSYGRK